MRLIEDGRFGTNTMKIMVSQNAPFVPMYDAWRADSRKMLPYDADKARRDAEIIDAKVLSNRRPPYAIAGGLYDALKATGGEFFVATNAMARKARKLFHDLEGVDIYSAAGVATASLHQRRRRRKDREGRHRHAQHHGRRRGALQRRARSSGTSSRATSSRSTPTLRTWWRRSRHCSTDASDQPGYEKDCHRFGFRGSGCFSSCPDAAGGVVQAFRRRREPLEQGARQADLRTLHARPVPRDRRQYRGLPERRRRLAPRTST